MESCVYCGSSNSAKLFGLQDIFRDKYHLKECKACATAFLSPSPSPEKLARAYSDDYYGEGETKFNPTVERVIDFFRKRNAQKMSKLFGGKGKVLDVGCGNGSFLYNLGLEGAFDLHGLELPGKSAERASKINEIKLRLGELKKDSFPKNSFDAITLFHVFEHLHNPKEVLEILQDILKPKGVLIIEFPNIASSQARLFKANWFHLDPPRHLNFFKPEPFKKIAKEYGFQCTKEQYFSPQFSPYGAQQSLLNFLGFKKDVLYEHLKGNKEYVLGYSKFSLISQQVFHWLTFPLFVGTDMLASLGKRGATVRFTFTKS